MILYTSAKSVGSAELDRLSASCVLVRVFLACQAGCWVVVDSEIHPLVTAPGQFGGSLNALGGAPHRVRSASVVNLLVA